MLVFSDLKVKFFCLDSELPFLAKLKWVDNMMHKEWVGALACERLKRINSVR